MTTLMKKITLVAINARYSHASLGMRCLRANLGIHHEHSILIEFTLQDKPEDMAKRIEDAKPSIIAIGVYIWNRQLIEALIPLLKSVCPNVPIVLGGPEISYDTHSALASSVTCVVCGEADLLFPAVCEQIMAGQSVPSVIPPVMPDLSKIALPYSEYSSEDLAGRNIYVETSRGCVYGCEFCMSSINPGIRRFPLERILPEFGHLLERGAMRFKFVDRCFNLAPEHACAVLDFFIARWQAGMCLHLEMTSDRITPVLRQRLLQFPRGGLHIEVGIQTFSREVARRVGRLTDLEAAAEGIRFLVNEAGADVHADLIAGLPGETPEMFEAGMDRLIALRPAELQIGILKRLHGAPIAKHEKEWAMKFRAVPPYDILSTLTMNEEYIQKIQRISKHWDRIVNRRWFPRAIPMLLENKVSPFCSFDEFSLILEAQLGLAGFGLLEASQILFKFLTKDGRLNIAEVRARLREDYISGGRRIGVPFFLQEN
jgi:radical SAM superfamily enzyme YgiQ (UPF0313 family)